MKNSELKIGMIGLDTSHAPAFARCFNKTDHAEHIAGGRVTVGYPGGSKDFDLSINRLEGYTKQLREEFGVSIVDSPEAVAEQADLVFIMTCDGRAHRGLFERVAKFGKPTFIDKPMATSAADAAEMFRRAKENGVTLMSCSSLRYAEPLVEALDHCADLGTIAGCDVFGPMEIHPPLPGLFWYGIHSVEMVNRIMGRGCKQVWVTTIKDGDVMTLAYEDGRVAVVRGLRKGHHKFGATIHREKGPQLVNASETKRSYYASLLDAVMRSLPKGHSDVEQDDTMEIMRILEAGNKARETGMVVKV
jgi:predicted dehydrogenase